MKHLLLMVTGGVVSCLALVLFSLYFWCIHKPNKIFSLPFIGFEPFFPRVSYKDLFKATNGFSRWNLIGGTNLGSVYKGKLGQGGPSVAVKVLNLNQQGASKSFLAECQALRNIRHRNLAKILTACSGTCTDFKGNEFKALVYEFMPKWLYPQERWRHLRGLSFVQRLNIAIDVASPMDYLHNQCHTPIIHCDLKPSNVLLDNDMNAHVSDFGFARLIYNLRKDNLSQFSSLSLQGTAGYAAPEYGMRSQLWPLGDVYSYGILLLEMFTGKRPTDELFKDEMNIHRYAKMALPDGVLEIVDKSFLSLSGLGRRRERFWL